MRAICMVLMVAIIFVATTHANGQSLEELIKEVFTTTPSTPTNIAVDKLVSPVSPKSGGNPCTIGECVPYYLCVNGTIITDGDGVLDIRFGGDDNENKELHPCTGVFETCCTLRSETPIIPTKPLKPLKPVQPVIVTGGSATGSGGSADTSNSNSNSSNAGCGYRNMDGVGFRIKGDKDNESQFGEFPWTVAILKDEQALGRTLSVYQCGGSLIHPSVVLTAAHCVISKKAGDLKIRAGEWDTQTTDEILPHQDRRVAAVQTHPQFYSGGLFNDVALLYLAEPVDLADNVNPACLPEQDASFDGSRCFASGWGKDLFSKEGKFQVILKRIELPIVRRDVCEEELRKTRLGRHFKLNPSFVCAGGELGKDTCKGDGGSPLVCPMPGPVSGRYQQAGIVAWGIGCGDSTPGVYVNVPLFRTWIDEQMRAKGFDTSSYTA